MNKQIIINADDFGLTRSINYAIIDSYCNQSIKATSLMINAPQRDHAVSLMKKYDLEGVGIHVNITLGKPVSSLQDIPSLINKDGSFKNNKFYLEGNHVNEDELIKEFDNQIQLFIQLTGQIPDHINYHHVYDFYNEYPRLFQFLVDKYHRPMRLEKDYDIYPFQYAYKADMFMNFENKPLEDFLQEQLIEVPCHIGYVDLDLMDISSYNQQRMKDYQMANSQEFKQLYQEKGYQLIGWKDVEVK